MMITVRSFLYMTLIVWLTACSQSDLSQMPRPAGETVIHSQGEDGQLGKKRKAWLELMHGGQASDWRNHEMQNQWHRYQDWQTSRQSVRSGIEWFANGQLSGEWVERGSNNNAGNIMVADFDAEEELIYAVGGGGPMFVGDLSGSSWQLVSDKLRFSTSLLKVFTLESGKKRIVSAVEGIPYYSEDGGATWVKSSGVTPTTGGWELYDSHITNTGIIFFIGRKDYNGSLKVYASFDKGSTFKALRLFNTSDRRNLALGCLPETGEVYVIEQTAANTSRMYRFNPTSRGLDQINTSVPVGFGAEGRANLQVARYRDTLRLYSFKEDKSFMMSNDEGKSWKKLSTLPTTPWEVGVYVCPSNPEHMIYGEVNAFRSMNGGFMWLRISEWWEYYGDIYSKLHADIMRVKEFRYKDGKPFLLNCNHGGIYISEDYGATHSNVGLFQLNVSQYYDVRTYPSNPYMVFAGSQDQGQQRGLLAGKEAAELVQNISGDYGHIEFTGNGKHLWSVYPGGWIGYYSEPLTQNGPIAGYEIKSSNETVWIPPIMPSPNPAEDVVYAAGGSTTPTSNGSHILRLEVKGTDIVASQLPFNFGVSGGQISAMATDPMDDKIWYVATTNGQFYRSEDGGQQFTRTAQFLSEAHYLYGSCILPSAMQKDVVYLSGNGYNYKPVYRSADGGKTFAEMSDGLPKTMVFNIVANEDETLLFAATEAGPYVCIVAQKKWYSLSGATTPNQTFWSVEYVAETRTARFATYGRGIWDFEAGELISSSFTADQANAFYKMFPNPACQSISLQCPDCNADTRVFVFDNQGKQVLSTTYQREKEIDLSALSCGMYRAIFLTKKGLKNIPFVVQ